MGACMVSSEGACAASLESYELTFHTQDGILMTAKSRFSARTSISNRVGSIMSHGAGGRAMAQLIDELFKQAEFDNEWLAPAATIRPLFRRSARSPHGDEYRRACGDATVLSGRGHRLTGGAWHDQRCRHVGRTSAAPGRELHPGGRLSAGRSGAHRRESGAGGTRGGCHGRDRRHQGRRTRQGRRGLHHHHRDRRGAGGNRDIGRPGATR
jgi:hypothetical protein